MMPQLSVDGAKFSHFVRSGVLTFSCESQQCWPVFSLSAGVWGREQVCYVIYTICEGNINYILKKNIYFNKQIICRLKMCAINRTSYEVFENISVIFLSESCQSCFHQMGRREIQPFYWLWYLFYPSFLWCCLSLSPISCLLTKARSVLSSFWKRNKYQRALKMEQEAHRRQGGVRKRGSLVSFSPFFTRLPLHAPIPIFKRAFSRWWPQCRRLACSGMHKIIISAGEREREMWVTRMASRHSVNSFLVPHSIIVWIFILLNSA